jgi:predicted TIM-barrel fold metal-dependent hydrolase
MDLHFKRLISADSHVMEPKDLWSNTLQNRFGDNTPRIIDEHLGKKGTFFYTGRQVLKVGQSDEEAQKIGFQEAGFVPEVRVKFQQLAGVTAEVLNATMMLLIIQGRYNNVVRECAAVFNDWLAEFCSHDSKRLIGVAMIPMSDVEWATLELERVAKKGHKGAIINLVPPEGCPPYRDPIYDPFWARAQELGIPITLHIITGRVPDPLHFHSKEEQGESPATQIALMYEVMAVLANEFIFGRILDRFPRMKLVCSEFEIAWIPAFMWRLDQMQVDFGHRLDLPTLDMKASDYMRERIWHGVIDDPFAAEAAAKIGTDRVMWGSDFPHVRSIGLDAQSRLLSMFEGLDEDAAEQIVGGTVADVFAI